MDENRLIKSLRFKLSLSFSIFIYLIVYILILLPTGIDRAIWVVMRWLIFLCIWNIFVFFLSYFIFYRRKVLHKLIFGDIKWINIILSQTLKHLFMGALLWGILGIRGYVMNAPAWMITTPIGAIFGFIFGLISSIAIVIIRRILLAKKNEFNSYLTPLKRKSPCLPTGRR